MGKKEKTNDEILLAFMKSNKDRRKVLAQREGFNDVNKYKEYLEMKVQLDGGIDELSEEVEKETITHITVLDCSYSMDGESIKVARKGISEDFLETSNNNEEYNIIRFGSNIAKHLVINSAAEIRKFSANMGMTALYDATIAAIKLAKTKSGKVLIKVFTDGGENDSSSTGPMVSKAIEEAQKNNITVTFIGQDYMINRLVDNLKVDRSNTLTYDGSTEDMNRSFKKMSASTVAYRDNVASGQNVSTGFYKTIN